jgi:hypothetical protein
MVRGSIQGDESRSKGLTYRLKDFLFKVHSDQLTHVRKGCLARPRQDISSDGSRIEGSHKGWNSLQRTQPSGIEVFAALSHDFVLRRNLRVALNASHKTSADTFMLSTHGSHHIRLINHNAKLFNLLRDKKKANNLKPLPLLPSVPSQEKFGVVPSEHTESFGGLLEIKEEESDDGNLVRHLLDSTETDLDANAGLGHLNMEGLFTMDEPVGSGSGEDHQILATVSSNPSSNDTIGILTSYEKNVSPIEEPRNLPFNNIIAKRKSPDTEGSEHSHSEDLLTSKKQRIMPQCQSGMHVGEDLPPVQAADSEPHNEPDESGHKLGTRSMPDHGADSKAHTFFKTCTPGNKPSAALSQRKAVLNSSPLSLPPSSKLTRSQLLFSVATRIDPRSLSISTSDEFFLFMDMRAEEGWVSFSMTTRKWIHAAQAYNERLEKLYQSNNLSTIKKNPRALVDKLGEIEQTIMNRIATANYMCTCFQFKVTKQLII